MFNYQEFLTQLQPVPNFPRFHLLPGIDYNDPFALCNPSTLRHTTLSPIPLSAQTLPRHLHHLHSPLSPSCPVLRSRSDIPPTSGAGTMT